MREAVRVKYIRTNPLDGVKPPKDIRKEPDVLTPEQVNHLLESVRGERFEAAYYILALVVVDLPRYGRHISFTQRSLSV